MQPKNEQDDDINALIQRMQQQGMQPEQKPMQQQGPGTQAAAGGDDIEALIQRAQQEMPDDEVQKNREQQIAVDPPVNNDQQAMAFKESIEEYNKSKIQVPEGFNLANYAEPVSRGVVSMLATAVNGLYSGAQALFPGDSAYKDIEQFNKRQDWINKNISAPTTAEGKTAQAGLEWLAEKAMVPVSGYAGLVELLMTQDLDKATDSIAQLQSGERSFGDIVGDANFEATGDPAWAAAVKTTVDGLPALLGARFVQKPIVDRRLDAKAAELQEQLQAQTMQQPKTGQLRDISPNQMANMQMEKINNLTQQRRRIDYDEMQMIEAEMRENPSYSRKIASSISAKPDPAAAEVIKQGASKGSVANMKATTPESRKIMRKMLGNANEVLNDDSQAAILRPSMAMGDIVKRRIGFLDNKRQQVGKQIESAVQNFDNSVIPLADAAPIANRFVDNLRKLGVKLDDKSLEPLFDDSSVRDIPAFRKTIVDTMRDLSTREMTASQLHFFKKRLDENISYNQKTEGLSAGVENALQGLRADINEYLGDINPAYREANINYAELKSTLDNAESAFKLKKKLQLNPKLQDAYDVSKIGQELRKTLSNYASGVDIRQTLTNIEDVTGKYGLRDNVQVNRLISFDNMLNGMMPSLIPGGLKSQIAQSIDSARIVAEPKSAILEKGLKLVDDVYDDMRGVNETNASKALTRMLNELDASNRKKTGTNINTRD